MVVSVRLVTVISASGVAASPLQLASILTAGTDTIAGRKIFATRLKTVDAITPAVPCKYNTDQCCFERNGEISLNGSKATARNSFTKNRISRRELIVEGYHRSRPPSTLIARMFVHARNGSQLTLSFPPFRSPQ